MTAAIGALGIGSTIGGGIASAVGAAATGQAQKSMYGYQAALSTIRSQIDKQNADYAIVSGEQTAQKYGMQAAQVKGQIKVAQAASGLDVNSGSAKQVQESQATVTKIDLDQIRQNAAKTAYNFNVQSIFDSTQAMVYKAAGDNAAKAATMNIESSILGTAGSVAGKWLQGQQMGLWGSPGASGDSATPQYGGS